MKSKIFIPIIALLLLVSSALATTNILSPVNNTVYEVDFVDLNWTTDITFLDWCGYSLDGASNETLTSLELNFLDNISGAGSPNWLFGAEDVFVLNNIAYVTASSDSRFTIFNVTDPSDIVHLGDVGLTGALGVVVIDEVAYVLGEGSLNTYNVTDPTSLSIFDSIGGNGVTAPYDLFVVGDVAYVTSSNEGVSAFNVSDPTNIFFIGNTTRPDSSDFLGVYVENNIAYAVDNTNSIFYLFNTTDPSDMPTLDNISGSGSPNFLGEPFDVYVEDGVAYIASCGDSALTTFDVSDPNNIAHLGNISGILSPFFMDCTQSVAVRNDIAYVVANFDEYIVVINVSNASNLVHIESVNQATVWSLVEDNGIIYSISGDDSTLATYSTIGRENTTLTSLAQDDYNVTMYCNDTAGVFEQSDYIFFTYLFCAYSCTNFTTCQPDVTGGYNNCTAVNETGECVYGGNFTEFQTFCDYCVPTEEQVLEDCIAESQIVNYQLTNNETCCALTGNSTDCTVTNSTTQECGYSNLYGAGEMGEVGIDLLIGILVGIVGFVALIALVLLIGWMVKRLETKYP